MIDKHAIEICRLADDLMVEFDQMTPDEQKLSLDPKRMASLIKANMMVTSMILDKAGLELRHSDEQPMALIYPGEPGYEK